MKIFIAGARKIDFLSGEVLKNLKKIMENNDKIFVGDADGVDKTIQTFLKSKSYNNVIVYSMENVRNNIGNWENIKIFTTLKKNTREYFTEKDKKMAEIADEGFMIWNKESKGTLNNIINLLIMNKKVQLYIQEKNKNTFYNLSNIKELENIVLESNSKKLEETYNTLLKRAKINYIDKTNIIQEKKRYSSEKVKQLTLQ
ncbi:MULTISPECIES: hypothetical protein [Fusobacterium]|jgi:hypothetical protein|uniref:Uncharacterized protein n=2 Tax=Fusobacterium TaxID=848 RepID=A0A3P1VNI6_FUSNU|nr:MULTISPECIES: hypothetical protein [Fusobacterium]ASG28766.1 hypothetical protein CBG61_07410 [Fusobacterium polymorphum]RRD35187.1 hypothetical protein EII28_10095 [Fusobacterium nucleatum]